MLVIRCLFATLCEVRLVGRGHFGVLLSAVLRAAPHLLRSDFGDDSAVDLFDDGALAAGAERHRVL